ncbi:MAG: peptidylprolyl isomerase [Promethearchaeota archaeon]|nr:MAG: peptidylprolyl isomerase [Candidatus Lokiarchaeota archaeon]
MGKNKYGKGYKGGNTSSGGGKGKKGGAPIKKGKIRASHILVDKYSQAQQIYEDIQAGESFEKSAKAHSTCPSRKRGGDLGKFTKSDMVSEFWNACASLQLGEISKPVKSQFGYHVIKRTA